MSTAEWEELEIPVGLAFFLRSSQRDEVGAFYPSPAGATECRLDLTAWARLVGGRIRCWRPTEADVEATLISRTDDTVEHFLVPIDACYELGRADAAVLARLRRRRRGAAEHRRVPGFGPARARFLPLARAGAEPGPER